MSTMTRGTDLTPSAKRDALARFVHRFTGDHKPAWANLARHGTACPVQFKNDADWLANTLFATNKDGSLSSRQNFCESRPTWPDNPELRIGMAQFDAAVERNKSDEPITSIS